jgi:hypothetical protein
VVVVSLRSDDRYLVAGLTLLDSLDEPFVLGERFGADGSDDAVGVKALSRLGGGFRGRCRRPADVSPIAPVSWSALERQRQQSFHK